MLYIHITKANMPIYLQAYSRHKTAVDKLHIVCTKLLHNYKYTVVKDIET